MWMASLAQATIIYQIDIFAHYVALQLTWSSSTAGFQRFIELLAAYSVLLQSSKCINAIHYVRLMEESKAQG